MLIDRCVCMDRSFADLLAQAEREGLDLDEVMAMAGEKGTRCGLCRPYLRVTLATGRVTFDRVLVDGESCGPDRG